MLTERFEEHRTRLRAVAYRLLGSYGEADAALREAGLRLSRADSDERDRTVVARVCLERLRSREAHSADPPDPWAPTPAERVASVLHDAFAVPFDEIAPIVERTPAAARQLVVRARRRMQGTEEMPEPDPRRQREVVTAFLAAARGGDLDELLALFDGDVVLRADAEAVRTGTRPAHGARAVARGLAARARESRPALVGGAAGLAWAPDGTPRTVFGFTVLEGRITAVDAIADREHLDRLDLRLP
ncbi:RNA polymerase subunit sigma-70 [Streptomyces sp. NPDC085481]|uniref:RNA polymerase subunit sigma-70 n=1 Tax=Streptomyces sp. NPDC085481 TaxID=3365727 RepID=UPI0037D130B2